MTRRLFVSTLVILLAQLAGRAGGPLQIEGGTAILWNSTQAIVYKIDKGPLGKIPEPAAQQFAEESFQKWGKVPTASLKFTATRMNEDVKTVPRFITLANDSSTGSVLILDNAGDIVKGIYGPGNEKNILGFASPLLSGQNLTRFVALMNGFLADNEATARSTMVHEFGHALGLDHAQINVAFAGNGKKDDDEFLPTMFPTSTDDDSTLIELNPDDMAWISRLYPNAEFSKTYGTIRGRLVRAASAPVLGANVVAAAVANGKEDPLHRYSCVSDYLMKKDGTFEIIVRPGTYKLMAEAVKPEFGGGSSVGPYAANSDGESFRNPIKPIAFAATHIVTAGQVIDVGVLTIK